MRRREHNIHLITRSAHGFKNNNNNIILTFSLKKIIKLSFDMIHGWVCIENKS